jgi:hypothetical protein
VLNKHLCVNWSHSFGNTGAAPGISIEDMSFFAQTLPGEDPVTEATAPEDGKRKGGKQKGLSLKELGVS